MPAPADLSPASATALSQALDRVHDRIDAACAAAGRPPQDVALLLATKTQEAATIRAALLADAAALADGRRVRPTLVGENRVQELVAKAPELADLGVVTHMIGPVQSNKINHVLRALALGAGACVETVDSLDLASRLSGRLAASGVPTPLDVLVQVNTSGEESKAGAAPEEAADLAVAVAQVPGLRLAGFMTIALRSVEELDVRACFARLRQVRDETLASQAPGTSGATTLSMGMSGDLEWAVAEGATVVRVGSAVFGAR